MSAEERIRQVYLQALRDDPSERLMQCLMLASYGDDPDSSVERRAERIEALWQGLGQLRAIRAMQSGAGAVA